MRRTSVIAVHPDNETPGLKTMKVDEYVKGELITKISKIFQELQPNIVYLPFYDDVHGNHRLVLKQFFLAQNHLDTQALSTY